jgi:hypothetical protein
LTSLAPFISQQDLTDYIGRDVTNDNGALMAIDAACDVIRDLTEQDFTYGTSTISVDGTGTDCIVLPQRPVANAGTVLVNGGTVTDYIPPSPDGFLYRGTVSGSSGWYSNGCWPAKWPRGRQNIRITYEHGYQAIDVPRSIRMVAISFAARLVVQGVAQTETVGDVTLGYGMAASDLTANELRIIKGYLATRSF